MTVEHREVDLAGKTAIVTGGSRGIGKAICLALAQAGASIVVAARSEKETGIPGTIHQTVSEIRDLGGTAVAVRCDVADPGDVRNAVEATIGAHGAIDILVNNAGILHGARFMETDMQELRDIWQVNVQGPFLCAKAVIPHMIHRGAGSIINISSGLALSTHPGNNAYSASKAALDCMMVKLAAEVAEHNIAVNQIHPGMIRSEGMVARIPAAMAERLPPPSVVGPPAVWLAAQDAASFTGKTVQASTFGSEWP